ncbi:MAG: hypothetical protein ACYC35_12980 [Pirellulales bacterium]
MRFAFSLTILFCLSCGLSPGQEPQPTDLESLAGQPADIAPSAYQYRADRKAEDNPPESWIGLMKYAGLPFDKPVDVNAPALKKVLCGLLWEEVRPVRRVTLTWKDAARRHPKPDEIALTYFNAEAKDNIPTWWNPVAVGQADKPEVSADGRTYAFAIPVDTFGLVVHVRGQQDASAYEVPVVRAFVPDRWKRMNLEIEWGFDQATTALDYSGRIEAYDGIVDRIRPLAADAGTKMTGPDRWRSAPLLDGRRGVSLSLLYLGTSKGRKFWPYNAEPEDVARTIITVWTSAGNFSFMASDLEKGPILAPEYGFFVRAAAGSSPPRFGKKSTARAAKEFVKELAASGLKTTRQRVREHAEQTWEGAVGAMFPGKTLPPIPKPELDSPMKVEVPSAQLSAQWNLGAWHLARHAVKNDKGQWRFNDHPYGILASETHLVLHVLDLVGMHKEAADGLDQWLSLPRENQKPVGLFSDGDGCLTHAVGPPGLGGNMDGIHAMGPGAIMFPLIEHFRLTGDTEWLKANAPRMKANVQWILRQRRLLASVVPGGERLWCKGLQPAHQVTPDSGGQLMQFYESEAYYWLAVRRFAEILTRIEPAEGARLAAEAESYRKDLLAAVECSIVRSPVVLARDGTYRSFVPFACYVRGFASGAWSWRRPGSGAHVGGLYWDTIQSAEPLVSPAGLLPPNDRRVQGALDVLEDRLLLENPKVAQRTRGYDPEVHWFAHAAWQYQPGLERHANIHLAADDPPNFLRSWLNQYAVLILPDEGYTFREHTTGGPPDKIFEEAAFLERFRGMLVMEEGDDLWLARATPRAWLEDGKKIAVQNAPTHFGTVAYQIVSSADEGKIKATVTMPSRGGQRAVLLRLRHPQSAPIQRVTVNGQPWKQFDRDKEVIRLEGLTGTVTIEARY